MSLLYTLVYVASLGFGETCTQFADVNHLASWDLVSSWMGLYDCSLAWEDVAACFSCSAWPASPSRPSSSMSSSSSRRAHSASDIGEEPGSSLRPPGAVVESGPPRLSD